VFHNAHLDCLPPQWTFDDLLAEKQKVKILEEELRHVRQAHARLKGLVTKGKKWFNLYGSWWDAGDWMMGVQYYSENDDGSFVQGEPHLDVCNSSELRLAGFELEQSCGLRQINARPRRGEQAAHQAELEADAAWLLPPATRGIAEAACREVAED